ncbi:MAG: secretin N-terminal domain-containing protein [Planctomycetales bacterium]
MASKTRRTAFGFAVGSLVVATGILLVGNSLSVVGIRGQGPQPLAAAETDFRPSAADEEEDDGDGTMVRLNFFNATWAAVLRKVAQDTGAELVMQKFPAGRYNRFDRTRYSRTDAVRILNRELEPKGFRILEQGNFLVLLQLDSLRTRYQRPLLPDDGELAEDEAAEDRPVRGVSSVKAPRRSAAGGEASTEFDEEQPLAARPADRRAEAANRGPQPRPRPAPAVEPASGTAEGASEATEVVVDARRSGAKEVARVIYSGLRDRSELIGNGPGNLPAFRVYRTAAAPTGNGEAAAARDARRAAANEPHFTIGIDADRDELVVSADAETQREIVQMIRTIDAAGAVRGRTVRLVSSDQELEGMAEKLQPVLDRMAAQNARRVAQLQPPPRGPLAPPAPEQPQPPPARPGAEQPRPEGEAPEAGPGAPPEGGLRIEGLHGPVRLRQTPGGLWIIEAADPRDADAVRRIIQELNLLVAGTLANVHLRPLQHVNSEAMAALLNDVYAELVTLRGGRVQASIIPVIKPNAILVLANATDLRTIDDLIVQLDAPVDPQTQFEVYSLRHAPATQVAATLQSLYPEAAPAPGTGLRPQVRVVADARTNTVIVQAAPRDLAEVALMIRRLDRDSSDAVSRMRIFPLKNAVALELAPVITEAIQSVLGAGGPPPAPPALRGRRRPRGERRRGSSSS